MKGKLKNRLTVSLVVAFAITVLLSPKTSEQSFLFPELTAFPSIAFDKESNEPDKGKSEIRCRFFIFEFIRDIFCTDNG